ncbi:hypothetical protein DSECCO2_400410 [anaerobic digester metagenome]
MTKTNKCLNEWNATVEALGQGKQTILLRNYGTTIPEFLLYPTASYTLKKRFLESFKEDYKKFAAENSLPKKENGKIEVKYFAKIEDLIKTSPKKIKTLKKYHIWTETHVKSYLNRNKSHVWILRVYELETPVMSQTNGGIKYANLKDEVSLDGIKPVMNDKDFNKLLEDIKSKV